MTGVVCPEVGGRASTRPDLVLTCSCVGAGILRSAPPAHTCAVSRTRATPLPVGILLLIAAGQTSKEIADLLVLSVKTIERHRADILHRLGMRDRVDLTRYAIRRGLIEP
jgi:DNA-binding NarL/FixJ family response regulator